MPRRARRFSPPVQEDRAVRFDRLAIRHAITGAGTVIAFALLWLPCGPAHAQTKLTAGYAVSLVGIAIDEGDWAAEMTIDLYTAHSSSRFLRICHVIVASDDSAVTHAAAN